MSDETGLEIRIDYGITAVDITAAKEKYGALTFDTPEAYETSAKGLREVVKIRTGIEARRKELNKDALAYQRRVNEIAEQLTGLVLEVETPLKAKKAVVDDERTRIEREAQAAEAARIQAERDAELAELNRLRAAEAARIEAERLWEVERMRVENEKLREAREQLDALRREAQQQFAAQQARLESERLEQEQQRAAIAAEYKRLEQIELDRLAEIEAARESEGKAAMDAQIDASLAASANAAVEREMEAAAVVVFDADAILAYADSIVAAVPPVPPREIFENYSALFWCREAHGLAKAAGQDLRRKVEELQGD